MSYISLAPARSEDITASLQLTLKEKLLSSSEFTLADAECSQLADTHAKVSQLIAG